MQIRNDLIAEIKDKLIKMKKEEKKMAQDKVITPDDVMKIARDRALNDLKFSKIYDLPKMSLGDIKDTRTMIIMYTAKRMNSYSNYNAVDKNLFSNFILFNNADCLGSIQKIYVLVQDMTLDSSNTRRLVEIDLSKVNDHMHEFINETLFCYDNDNFKYIINKIIFTLEDKKSFEMENICKDVACKYNLDKDAALDIAKKIYVGKHKDDDNSYGFEVIADSMHRMDYMKRDITNYYSDNYVPKHDKNESSYEDRVEYYMACKKYNNFGDDK